MEHQKIINLLNEPKDSKFETRNWNIVNGQSNATYDVENEIFYNTEVWKSSLCDYSDAYILLKGDSTLTAAPATQLAFKNCAPFTKCIIKFDRTTKDGAEELDLVMPKYNLKECSSNYSQTRRSLWLYSKDEATQFNNNFVNIDDVKSFRYKDKSLENTKPEPNLSHTNGILKNTATAVSLKYLRIFGRSLEMPLINCKGVFKLKWTKYCVLSKVPNDNLNATPNNNFFYKKHKIICSCTNFISRRQLEIIKTS